MVGVQGVGGVQEPNKPERSTNAKDNTRAQEVETESSASSDDLTISSEAAAAARVAASIKAAENQPDIRADRVAAAKAAIERGDYKNPEVVESVAQKISKYL